MCCENIAYNYNITNKLDSTFTKNYRQLQNNLKPTLVTANNLVKWQYCVLNRSTLLDGGYQYDDGCERGPRKYFLRMVALTNRIIERGKVTNYKPGNRHYDQEWRGKTDTITLSHTWELARQLTFWPLCPHPQPYQVSGVQIQLLHQMFNLHTFPPKSSPDHRHWRKLVFISLIKILSSWLQTIADNFLLMDQCLMQVDCHDSTYLTFLDQWNRLELALTINDQSGER